MGTIAPDLSGIVDGQVGDAVDWTNPINTIVDTINGGLDTANFTAGSTNLATIAQAVAWSTASLSATGMTGITATGRYLIIGKTCIIKFNVQGTSNATTFTITGLPAAGIAGQYFLLMGSDNSTVQTLPLRGGFESDGTTLTIVKTITSDPFTASGAKQVYGTITYEIA